ncbi:P-loop NTPase fold protein [Dermabacteraceae bacterium P13138]
MDLKDIFSDAPAEKDLLSIDDDLDGLVKVIETCSTPYTIAVCGERGTGKTTLVSQAKKKLSEKNLEGYTWIELDVWQKDFFDEDPKAVALNVGEHIRSSLMAWALRSKLVTCKTRKYKWLTKVCEWLKGIRSILMKCWVYQHIKDRLGIVFSIVRFFFRCVFKVKQLLGRSSWLILLALFMLIAWALISAIRALALDMEKVVSLTGILSSTVGFLALFAVVRGYREFSMKNKNVAALFAHSAMDTYERRLGKVRRDIERQLKHNRKHVVLIDNLDRISPDIAGKVLESLKSVLNFDGVVYLVMIDEQLLNEAASFGNDSGPVGSQFPQSPNGASTPGMQAPPGGSGRAWSSEFLPSGYLSVNFETFWNKSRGERFVDKIIQLSINAPALKADSDKFCKSAIEAVWKKFGIQVPGSSNAGRNSNNRSKYDKSNLRGLIEEMPPIVKGRIRLLRKALAKFTHVGLVCFEPCDNSRKQGGLSAPVVRIKKGHCQIFLTGHTRYLPAGHVGGAVELKFNEWDRMLARMLAVIVLEYAFPDFFAILLKNSRTLQLSLGQNWNIDGIEDIWGDFCRYHKTVFSTLSLRRETNLFPDRNMPRGGFLNGGAWTADLISVGAKDHNEFSRFMEKFCYPIFLGGVLNIETLKVSSPSYYELACFDYINTLVSLGYLPKMPVSNYSGNPEGEGSSETDGASEPDDSGEASELEGSGGMSVPAVPDGEGSSETDGASEPDGSGEEGVPAGSEGESGSEGAGGHGDSGGSDGASEPDDSGDSDEAGCPVSVGGVFPNSDKVIKRIYGRLASKFRTGFDFTQNALVFYQVNWSEVRISINPEAPDVKFSRGLVAEIALRQYGIAVRVGKSYMQDLFTPKTDEGNEELAFLAWAKKKFEFERPLGDELQDIPRELRGLPQNWQNRFEGFPVTVSNRGYGSIFALEIQGFTPENTSDKEGSELLDALCDVIIEAAVLTSARFKLGKLWDAYMDSGSKKEDE